MSTDPWELLKEAHASLLEHCAKIDLMTDEDADLSRHINAALAAREKQNPSGFAPPDSIPRDLHERLIREAKREVLREAADDIASDVEKSHWLSHQIGIFLRSMADELK